MADEFGLNKTARLQARRADRQKKDAPLPLNPPFPYEVIAFDPVFFGVESYSDQPPNTLTNPTP
jgi:hypothetical protein